MSSMSEKMDELVEKATAAIINRTVDPADAVHSIARQDARAALEAVGLPALLERVEAAGAGEHRLNEYGTTDCPVEHVRANVDDGECSACGASVGPMVADPLARMSEAFKREHRWRMEVTAECDALAAKVSRVEALADEIATEWVAPSDEEQERLSGIAGDIRAALTEDPTNKEN